MRFLIDNALSPLLALKLKEAGHDALHVRDIGIQSAPDHAIFDRAVLEDRIVVSADTDFGTLLALRQSGKPSVILFRQSRNRSPDRQSVLLISNLPRLEKQLIAGCIIVFEDTRIRLRALPIGSGDN